MRNRNKIKLATAVLVLVTIAFLALPVPSVLGGLAVVTGFAIKLYADTKVGRLQHWEIKR